MKDSISFQHMATDLFDFLNPTPTHPSDTPKTTGFVTIITRADMDCQVACDGEFLFALNANRITKERIPTGNHVLEFIALENPALRIEKIVDFPVPGKNHVLLVDEFKKLILQKAEEKTAAEAAEKARIKAEADAKARAKAEEEARKKAEAEAIARAKAEAEARERSAEEARARAKAEAEARERAEAEERERARRELEAKTPKFGTLRIASRRTAGLEARYEGFVLNGKPEGHGIAYYDNGHRYDGDWKAGLKCGHGSYYWPDGESYVGEWANDSMCGQGVRFFTNGNRYEGEFKDGLMDGKGVFVFENGNRHVSTWNNNKPGKQYRFYYKSGGYVDGNSWYGNFPYGGFDGIVTNQDGDKFYYENGNLICNIQKDGILFRTYRDVLLVIKYHENSCYYPEIVGVYYDIEKGRKCAEEEHCWYDEKILSISCNLSGKLIQYRKCYIALQAFDDSTRAPIVVAFDGNEEKVRSILSQKSGHDFSYRDNDNDYDHNCRWRVFCEDIVGFPKF